MTAASSGLTVDQSSVLFDILTHHQTYDEIEGFKHPDAIQTYGPPFQDDSSARTSPVLQMLLAKFVLPLPGLRDIRPQFWKLQVGILIRDLSEAELSESYDKGVLGVRKSLATAISSLIEYPARGCLGGFPAREVQRSKKYDIADPDDVMRAWRDSMQAIIYGDLIEELVNRAAETDDLLKHDSLVQGMHEFIIVNLASLMHYTLCLSPEGSTLLRMIDNVHRLLPYTMIRQTLKIGNVATMISAMMKVILTKASVSTVTNWIGLTTNADEGMNLLQQIVSQVLSWDKRELRKRAEKIERGTSAPSKPVGEALRTWIQSRSRAEHQECRRMSRDQQMSIIAVILSLSSGTSLEDLSESQHKDALEWFALQLSIRDRQKIIKTLCQRNPDHLTTAIQDAVAAYTPMIRRIHQAVNLADTMWDLERFITDMLKTAKPSPGGEKDSQPPAVEDFVDLLHRHQSSSHKFLHQVAKNDKEVLGWWREYVQTAAQQFRADPSLPSNRTEQHMKEKFSSLPAKDQADVTSELAAHAEYLDELHAASAARIAAVVRRTRSTPFGPGAYLARWQDLLDKTIVTPATVHGNVRLGGTQSVREDAKDVDGTRAGGGGRVVDKMPPAPSVAQVVRIFGPRFREALQQQ